MYRVFWSGKIVTAKQLSMADCPNVSNQNVSFCECPKRLALNTVNSYMGKPRAIFNEAGRTGDWNGRLGFENPAASVVVQGCLKAVSEQ